MAFLGSLGHCIGMCGGFIVAYSSAKVDDKSNRVTQFISHFLYNIGRVTSYVVLGIVFGLIGTIFSLSATAKGILLVIIAIFMLLMGISLMG